MVSSNITTTAPRDLTAGLVVFLVALPLCLGVALAAGAPLFSGLLAGIVGGVLVGMLSGSQTSVSGPSPAITAIVAAQIVALGSFEAFLLAVLFAGLIQIVLGLARAGFIAAFFPSSVIKGLLASVGIILILKQIPHLFGHDSDPEGDLAFFQPDRENTFSEFGELFGDFHFGATAIGLGSIAILVLWDRWPLMKKSVLPAPLIVVLFGVVCTTFFRAFGKPWLIETSHLVQVPIANSVQEFFGFLMLPDWGQWKTPAIYVAASTLAVVASLETLLNLEAVDKIDPKQRNSPASRELVAQGIGNAVCGLIGGLPIASVVVRSSVNINAGGQTKLATIVHGLLLLISVGLLPVYLNTIPISCLAAILLVTGVKLASPKLIKQMWAAGRYQFIPFAITIVAIVFTDLLTGVLIGLAVSVSFILSSNMRRPLRTTIEKHLGGDVVHIELASQVSFLNRAAIDQALNNVPRGGQVLLDARGTSYIDPDILDLIRDFKDHASGVRGVEVSLLGFRNRYQIEDKTQYVDHSTRELQSALTPQQVLQLLKDGHDRFRNGYRLTRDFRRQVNSTAAGQHPLAVILSCIDSRTPAELIFDLGMGDIFSVRIAGNITSPTVLGSAEYGCAVVGAKLILVMGHTNCGAVTAAVDLVNATKPIAVATGCAHVEDIVHTIWESFDSEIAKGLDRLPAAEKQKLVNDIARRNVAYVVGALTEESETLAKLVREGRIVIVGAMYDVSTGDIEFLPENSRETVLPFAPRK